MRAALWPVAILTCVVPFALAAPVSFPLRDVPRAYPVPSVDGRSPEIDGLVVADLDLDGKTDVLANGPYAGYVLYGRPDGSLEPGIPFGAGGGAYSTFAIVADVDGDGFPDIVSAGYQSRFAVVLRRNAGHRMFEAPATLYETELPRNVRPVAAADFNGDGAVDIVVASGYSPTAPILLINDGHGGVSKRLFPNFYISDSTVARDLDGDGDPDLAVGDGAGVSVFLNNGNGEFVQGPQAGEGGTIVTADLDRDGRPDVISLHPIDNRISIHLAANGFRETGAVAANQGPASAVAGDYNNDGQTDIAVFHVGTYPRTIVIYFGDGRGGLARGFEFAFSTQHRGLAAADMNRDGFLDLIVPAEEGVAIVLGNRNGTFRVPPRVPGLAESRVVGAADFDGNGIDELLLTDDQTLSVGWMNDDGTYRFERLPFPTKHGFVHAAGAAADSTATLYVGENHTVHALTAKRPGEWTDRTFDTGEAIHALQTWRDGNTERIAVITGTSAPSTLRVFTVDGTQLDSVPIVRAPSLSFREPPSSCQIDVTDVDRDGVTDLLVTVLSSRTYWHAWIAYPDGYVSLLRGRGNGRFAPQEVKLSDVLIWSVIADDVNNDGASDVAIRDSFYDDDGVVLLGDGHGNFFEQDILVPAQIADLNLDGLNDLEYRTRITYGTRNGQDRTVRYFDALPSTLARRRRNEPPSLVGNVDYRADTIVIIDLAPLPPSRVRAVRH